MNALIALVRKDLVLYFSSRRSVLMSIAAPILIAAFFGNLMGGHDNGPANIPVAMTDLDQSALSARIVAALRADTSIALSETDESEGAAQVKAGKVRAAIVLPAGFGAQAGRALFGVGDKPEIVLAYDPSQNMVLPMVRGLLAEHVMENVSRSVFSGPSPALADQRRQVMENPERRLPVETNLSRCSTASPR
jgi:ABC-2 type transport system permease protein